MQLTVIAGTFATVICLIGYAEPYSYKQRYPNTEIRRQNVPKDKKAWTASYPDYGPPQYTAPCDGECDPDSPEGIVFGQVFTNSTRKSWGRIYKVDANNYPLNPRGRTGLAGRGALPRWGPNHMGLIVITRNRDSELLALKTESSETKPALLMATMECEHKCPIPPKINADFKEELLKYFDKTTVTEILNSARKDSKQLYQGYFPDEVNTDNAWTELVIFRIQDPLLRHIGKMKFNDSNSKYEWKKYNKNVVDQVLKSLMLISDMSLEEKVIHKFRTSLWSMKKRKAGEWAARINVLFQIAMKIGSVLRPIIFMAG